MRGPAIRTRLTLVFAGMTVVVLGIGVVALVLGFRSELWRSVDEGLVERASTLAVDPLDAVTAMTGSDDVFAQVSLRTEILAASPGLGDELLPLPPSIGSCEPEFLEADVTVGGESIPARLYAICVQDGLTLVVGQEVEDQRLAIARLTAIVAIGGPILLAAMAGLGWVLAGAALRPVERLRAEAAALSLAEPARRLPVPETGDELQRLAETLNGMLDRVHESLERERRLVDEASHELRTPLGVVQAELDLALREPRSRQELEAALRSITQETERLRRLTEDLLVLARSDRGRIPVHRTDVDVSEILERVAHEFADSAARVDVEVRVSGPPLRARLDGDRVRQAVENLVANAIRHADRGGIVEVTAVHDADALRIVVRDPGPGFAEDVLDRAFEPFARADGDRANDGAGLGLAIVRAVAEAHGGSATARNLDGGGAEVSIEVPI